MANIFDSTADALVNTINCVGVMGGGLAGQFRIKYPEMNEAYEAACKNGEVQVGKMWNWYDEASSQWLINFPTIDRDWANPTLDYIVDGLKDLQQVIADLNLTSIAIPALGCGIAGFKWEDVQPLIHSAMNETADDVEVEIYTPDAVKYLLIRHDSTV